MYFPKKNINTISTALQIKIIACVYQTPFFTLSNLPAPPVLPYIGCNGCAECYKDTCDQVLDLGSGGKACNIDCPVNVNRTLYNDRSNPGDGKLQAHRCSQRQKFFYTVPGNMEILFFQMQNQKFLFDIQKTQQR